MSFKVYMNQLIKDEKRGPMAGLLKGILFLLSVIYALAQRIITLEYSLGLRKVHKAKIPVISVGNLTVGGTGKTPFTVFVVEELLKRGKKPAMLIRGYGSDENVMLSNEFADVPVLSGQDRVKSASKAAGMGRDIAVLDDGFQHKRIHRDLEIVLVDGVNGFGNGHLLPRGPLRESPEALSRADILILTKSDAISEEKKRKITGLIARHAPDKPVLCGRHKVLSLTDITGQSYPAEELSRERVILVSGIGDPGYFHFLVDKLGANIVSEERYQDHHAYTQKDIDHLMEIDSMIAPEKIIVTKKDLVKMKELDTSSIENKIFALNINIEITEGEDDLGVRLDRCISG